MKNIAQDKFQFLYFLTTHIAITCAWFILPGLQYVNLYAGEATAVLIVTFLVIAWAVFKTAISKSIVFYSFLFLILCAFIADTSGLKEYAQVYMMYAYFTFFSLALIADH